MTKPGRIHIVIPDTQVKPGVRTEHLGWIGQYIVDEYRGADVSLIHLGDHWDLPSLSSYDKGKRSMEGRRYKADIAAGNAAFGLLDGPISRCKGWKPEKHFLMGNHENRIVRACEDSAQLDGAISLDDLDTRGWQRHKFLEPAWIDGVGYAHYWYAPLTGNPLGGMIETRLKNVGHSFTMGHVQTLMYGVRFVGQRSQHALVAGACYLHDEDYKGPQGNAHWRGIIVKHQVKEGSYDPMFVSLNYLSQRYTKRDISSYLAWRQR